MPLTSPEGVEAIGHSYCPRLTSCVMLHPVAVKLATKDLKFVLICSAARDCNAAIDHGTLSSVCPCSSLDAPDLRILD